MPATVGTAAIEFQLPDTDGRLRSLREFHLLGPVALIFLPTVRGWRPRWQLWSLFRHCDQFVHRGVEVVLVSADAVPELRIFQIRRGLPFVFLSDLDRRVAFAYDARLGHGGAGALIVSPAGRIVWRRIAGRGPRPSAASLLRVLRHPI